MNNEGLTFFFSLEVAVLEMPTIQWETMSLINA